MLQDFAKAFGRWRAATAVALGRGQSKPRSPEYQVQLTGFVPVGKALRRTGGRPGDWLFVSARWAMRARDGCLDLRRPVRRRWILRSARRCRGASISTARIALGQALRGVASACMDLSDGLLADLPRLAMASGCGADLQIKDLPLSGAAARAVRRRGLAAGLTGR